MSEAGEAWFGPSVEMWRRPRASRPVGPEVDRPCGEVHRTRVIRRARARVRRYSQFNRLSYLWTFTYETAQYGWDEAKDDWGGFIRRHRRRTDAIPFVVVREPHKAHGLHLHALFGQRLEVSEVESDWRLGHVYARRFEDRGRRPAPVVAALYVSKAFSLTDEDYVSAGVERKLGTHLYSTAQGFSPRTQTISVTSREQADELVREIAGRAPSWRYRPRSWDYHGPPMLFCRW